MAGATIIDAGVKVPGGFEAGILLTELCLGGAGKAELGFKTYGDLSFPSVTVTSDHPAIAMLGSQFAGWRIKDGDQIAIGSGPARALALKPRISTRKSTTRIKATKQSSHWRVTCCRLI